MPASGMSRETWVVCLLALCLITLCVFGYAAIQSTAQLKQAHAVQQQRVGDALQHIGKLVPAPSSQNSRIPVHLHFLFGLWDPPGTPLPAAFQRNFEAWQRVPRVASVTLWDAAAIETVIPDEWRALYEWLPRGVQRADLARIFVLQARGGIYLDLDVTPRALPLASLVVTTAQQEVPPGILLFREATLDADLAASTRLQPIRAGVPEPVGPCYANYAMGSTVGHRFWGFVLGIIRRRLLHARKLGLMGGHVAAVADETIIFTTGPNVITHAVNRLLRPAAVRCPTAIPAGELPEELRPALAAELRLVPREVAEQVLIHHETSTWRSPWQQRLVSWWRTQ